MGILLAYVNPQPPKLHIDFLIMGEITGEKQKCRVIWITTAM